MRFTLTSILFLFIALLPAKAQLEPAKKIKGRPDIPGTFMIEYGFNFLSRYPQKLDLGFWGSRTFNVYYQYDKQLGTGSPLSVHGGIGFSFERFKLLAYDKYLPNDTLRKSNPTLTLDANRNTTFIEGGVFAYGDTAQIVKKSMFINNFVDVPIEFRYSTNPNDPARSFKVAIGGRMGVLLNAQTKMTYREDGETKKLKDRQDYNLSLFRYSAFGRIGVGNIYGSFYYNFNPWFKEGKGPAQTQASTYTFTLTLASF
jgi:hypothetical protein